MHRESYVVMTLNGEGSTSFISPASVVTIAVPVIALVFALLYGKILILHYVHVLTGGTWTGVDLFMGLVMIRVMGGLEPSARVQFVRRMVPIMLFFMPAIAFVSITSGIFLAQWEGIFILHSPWIIISGVLVVILTVQGFGIILPNELRIFFELRKEKPDTQKIIKLGMRNFKIAGSQAIFQCIIIFAMARLAYGMIF